METKQYSLCLEVLRRLESAGVLSRMVLIGSWCLIAYREYFRHVGPIHAVRTRDIDFLVPPSSVFPMSVNVPELMKDLGFLVGFRGEQGAMMLEHPELMVEFLVPERGRGGHGTINLPQLGMNAQALRFMDIALMKTLPLDIGGIKLVVPHPAAFALHKLLIVPRRKTDEKRNRDFETAVLILDLVEKKGDWAIVQDLVARFTRTWTKSIRGTLQTNRQAALAAKLTSQAAGAPI